MVTRFFYTKVLIALALSLLSAARSNAATDELITSISGNQIRKQVIPYTLPPSLSIQDQKYPYTTSTQFAVKKAENRVTLRYDDSKRTADAGWTLTVEYTIDIYNSDGTVVNTFANQALTITYDGAGSYKDKDMRVYDDGYKAVLRVTDVSYTPGGGSPTTLIPSVRNNDIYLDLEQRTERYYYVDYEDAAPAVMAGAVTTANELPVSWTYLQGAESYDIEWLFIDAGTSALTGDFDFDFTNATRINTTGQHYNIPLAYPQGVLLFRVRGVGININTTPAFTNRVTSLWSVATTLTTGNTSSIPSTTNDYRFNWNGMDVNYNWQYTAAYAEEGKRKEMMSYFDGSLRNRQSVTVLNSDNNAVIAETKYDFEGRPAVQMMPTPFLNSGIRYYSNFNPAYEKNDFDRDANTSSPAPVSIGDQTGKFYSPSNSSASTTNTYIPDAEGYPFSRTRYIQDGTGRVESQSGVGINHTIGSGHEIKYYYGSPLQPELDRLFGNEAGSYKHYKKNMVRDANGQLSVSYLDQAGRVIATALAGDHPDNLLELDIEGSGTAEEITADLLTGNNNVSGDSKVSETTITVSSPGDYTFSYTLGGHSFCKDEPCENICEECRYDLLIEVRDRNNQPVPLAEITGSPCYVAEPAGYISCSNMASGSYDFIATLTDAGTYTITKTLSIHYPETQALVNTYSSCISLPQIEPAGCETCQSICENTYTGTNSEGATIYVDDDGITEITESEALDKIAQCKAYCEGTANVVDECTMKKRILLGDMSPGGQYFDNMFAAAVDRNDWLNAKVLDENTLNDADFDDAFEALTGTAGMHNWDDVRNSWQDEWAEDLVAYHPEICAWNYFCGERNVCAVNSITMDRANDYGNDLLWDNTGAYYNPLNLTLNTAPSCSTTTTFSNYNPHAVDLMKDDEYFTQDCLPDLSFPECSTTAVDPYVKMRYLLQHYNVLYNNGTSDVFASLYYFLDDPDGIISGSLTSICSHPIDPSALALLKSLHGDPAAPAGTAAYYGLFGGPSPVSTPYKFFKSTYLYLRNLMIYKGFESYTCPVGYTNSGNAFIADTPTDILYYTTTIDGNLSRYQIRYPQNDGYEAILAQCEPFDFSTLNTALPAIMNNSNPDVVAGCASACEGNADYWITQISENCSSLSPSQLSEIRQYLVAICSQSCGIEHPAGQTEIPDPGVSFGLTGPYNTFAEVLAGYGCSYTIVHPQPDESAGACSCTNFISYVQNTLSLDPYNPAHHASIASAMNTTFSPAVPYTEATVQGWVGACSVSPNSDAAAASGGILSSLPSSFICEPKARAICSCENLKAYAVGRGISLTDYAGIAAALNADYSPDVDYTGSQVSGWLSTCEAPQNSDMEEAGALYDLPLSMKCPDPQAEPLSDCDIANAQASADAAYMNGANLLAAATNAAYNYLAGYRESCLTQSETFSVTYDLKEYHYTLYYYDQAGNLVKTVPPQGVHVLTGSTTPALADVTAYRAAAGGSSFSVPAHTMVTNYKYNSLQQLVEQSTPDAGLSTFWYDVLGRLVVSQNAKQQPADNYSYTVYDDLGRINQVGEANSATAMDYATSRSETSLGSWLATATRSQVTRTVYDDAVSSTVNGYFGAGGQQNLRNRVSSTLYTSGSYTGDPLADAVTTYDNASHYSYDIHGNVKTLIQENTALAIVNTAGLYDLKFIDYDYDLVSGNVKKVSYQNREDAAHTPYADRFFHRYYYDADNRITEALTSFNDVIWQKEAKYFYYPHGPLSRTELGDKQVQGTDYAYTIQGWIKGVNDDTWDASRDIGKDGVALLPGTATKNNNANFAYDAMGYTLGYFPGDYKAVNTSLATTDKFEAATGGAFIADAPALYNGNISHIKNIFMCSGGSSVGTLGRAFQYDQLNRIREANSYLSGTVQSTNSFTGATASTAYAEEFHYDPNGNILQANRNGASTAVDQLEYHYYTTSGGTYTLSGNPLAPADATNKLADVSDVLGSFGADLGNQSASNYTYDAIGNLVKDVTEEIDNIEWTIYGKIKSITRSASSTRDDLEFEYDAGGNRIVKIVKPRPSGSPSTQDQWQYTYYVRDAQGNVMAAYNREFEHVAGTQYLDRYSLAELDIYGSARLGQFYNRNISLFPILDMPATSFYATFSGLQFSYSGSHTADLFTADAGHYERFLGYKKYEINNHLGNVMAVISDRKTGVDNTGDNLNDYYLPDVLNSQDYYAFGATMPGRGFVGSSGYRYGFNGKENDDEVKGDGNQQDYGMRIYDPRLGKFLSKDPIGKIAPWASPYSFAGNTPIWATDLDGMYPVVRNATLNGITYTFTLDTETPQDIKISAEGEKFSFTFKSEYASRQSLKLLKDQYSDVINTAISKTTDDYVSKDVKKMSAIIHADVDIGELVTALLEQNPDLKLLVVGNHAIPITKPFLSSTGSTSRGLTPDEDWKLQLDFTLKRAQTVQNTYFKDAPNVTPLSQGTAREYYPGIELKPLGKEAVGITIFFDFSAFPKDDPSKERKHKKKETRESHMNVRFL